MDWGAPNLRASNDGWDNDAAGGGSSAFDGASDFLRQLQAESAAEGFANGTLGSYEDDDDCTALSALPSSSEEEEEDEDEHGEREDVLKAQLSCVWRTKNKLSKPRYLKKYFMLAIFLQLMLYIAFFVGATNCEACTYGHLIVLIMMGGLLLGVQFGQASDHFKEGTEFEEFDVDNPQLVYQHKRKLSWHSKMIFYPCLVAVYATFIFYTGLFSLLFGYAKQPADANATCTSKFSGMLHNFDAAGWVYMLWQIFSYASLLFALLLLALTHFRAYNDTTARHNRISLVAIRWKQRIGMHVERDMPTSPRGSINNETLFRRVADGLYLKTFFVLSIVLQFFLYLLLGISRSVHNGSGQPAELGFGMLYFWTVVGFFFWGYELGLLHNYTRKAKNALRRSENEAVHRIRSHLSWHSHMVYMSCVKCIGVTTVYFVAIFSFIHHFSVSTGSCPTTPGEGIGALHFKGFLLFSIATVLVIPIVLCEIGLCVTHFGLWKAYMKICSAASLKLACKSQ